MTEESKETNELIAQLVQKMDNCLEKHSNADHNTSKRIKDNITGMDDNHVNESRHVLSINEKIEIWQKNISMNKAR